MKARATLLTRSVQQYSLLFNKLKALTCCYGLLGVVLIDEGNSEFQMRQGGLVLLIFLLLASQEDADLVGVSWKPNRV